MDASTFAAMLIWVAQAIGVPTPPMPVVYPAVPEQQRCALVTSTPCDPYIHARQRPTVGLVVAPPPGKRGARVEGAGGGGGVHALRVEEGLRQRGRQF